MERSARTAKNWASQGCKGDPTRISSLRPPALWDKAQTMLQERSKVNPRTHDGIALLTGLLRCPQCGTPMVTSRTVNRLKDGTKVVRRYYSCGRFKSQGSSVCHANSIGADFAEQYVLGWLKSLLGRPKIVADVVAAVNRKKKSNIAPMRNELAAIEHNQATLDQRRQRLLDLYELNGVDKSALTIRLNELAAEEESLHARISELKYDLDDDGWNEIPIDAVQKALTDTTRLLDSAPPEQKKALLRLLIKEISITEGRRIEKIVLRISMHPKEKSNLIELPIKTSHHSFKLSQTVESN